MYNFLFENAPVSLWEEDYTEVIDLLDKLPESAKKDLHKYFHENPGDIDRFKSALKIVNVNAASVELFEADSKAELIEKVKRTFTGDSTTVFVAELSNLLSGLFIYAYETEMFTLRGSRKSVNLRIHINQDDNNQPLYSSVIVAINDISRLQSTKSALESEKYRTERYLNLANVLFVSLNRNGIITMANTKLCDILNLPASQVIGRPWVKDFISPEDQDSVISIFTSLLAGNTQVSDLVENTILSSTGKSSTVEWFHTVLRDEEGEIEEIVASGTDVTRERQLESKNREMQAQLMQSQKLNSISTLARGVAHEINNPLTGLLNYANILEEEIEDEELRDFAQGIQVEGTRVAKIVSNLLTFARIDMAQRQSVDVRELIDRSVMLIKQSLLTNGIDLEVSPVPEGLKIFCKIQELQQVILNLLTNSWQAIEDKTFEHDSGKKISIITQVEDMDGKETICMRINDNGIGIKEEHLESVFDPFFSVKSRIRRTGMGLAVAYGIVQDHGGSISISSEYGIGTEVELHLVRHLSEIASEIEGGAIYD